MFDFERFEQFGQVLADLNKFVQVQTSLNISNMTWVRKKCIELRPRELPPLLSVSQWPRRDRIVLPRRLFAIGRDLHGGVRPLLTATMAG